ncbi:MAG: hypothetical protein KatS3mg112_0012 [Thermogutta sp.]|nr:MAG: hypothetical protein KatS3mg112_0012 [Thermogutta sp.]
MNCPYQNLMTSAILHFRTRQFGTQAYRDPIDWPQAVSPMNGLPVQSAVSRPGFFVLPGPTCYPATALVMGEIQTTGCGVRGADT